MDKSQRDELIKGARVRLGRVPVTGGMAKNVVAAVLSESGKIFYGSNLDTYCGIGFCAEHAAVASMILEEGTTHIKAIVAVSDTAPKEIIPPCGRCRQMLELVDKKNLQAQVILPDNKDVSLSELLPLPFGDR